jgi:hypothetical protein
MSSVEDFGPSEDFDIDEIGVPVKTWNSCEDYEA